MRGAAFIPSDHVAVPRDTGHDHRDAKHRAKDRTGACARCTPDGSSLAAGADVGLEHGEGEPGG